MFTGVKFRYLFEQLTSTDLTKKKKKKKIRISQIRILEYYCKQMSNTKLIQCNILFIKCRLKIKI